MDPEDLEVVKNLSKDSFKRMINQGVEFVTTEQLKTECSNLKKTTGLEYGKLQTQLYLQKLYPAQAKLILQARGKTLDIKTHNPYKFQEEDLLCRKCGRDTEILEHVINCGHGEIIASNINFKEDPTELLITQLRRTANRIQQFYDDVAPTMDTETVDI